MMKMKRTIAVILAAITAAAGMQSAVFAGFSEDGVLTMPYEGKHNPSDYIEMYPNGDVKIYNFNAMHRVAVLCEEGVTIDAASSDLIRLATPLADYLKQGFKGAGIDYVGTDLSDVENAWVVTLEKDVTAKELYQMDGVQQVVTLNIDQRQTGWIDTSYKLYAAIPADYDAVTALNAISIDREQTAYQKKDSDAVYTEIGLKNAGDYIQAYAKLMAEGYDASYIICTYAGLPDNMGGNAELVSKYAVGDVVVDNQITVEDAVVILENYAEIAIGQGTVDGTAAQQMDVNHDGTIDLQDANSILTYYAQEAAGLETTISLD